MKKSYLLIMATLLVGMTVLSGCSSGGKEKEDADGKVHLRFSSWDSDESLDLQQALVDKFNEKNPDIQVTLEAYGSDYDTKIAAGIGAKDAPDVMYMWNYPQYKDALEPLDEYINAEGDKYKENFYETLWNYNSLDEVTLGIPTGFTTHGVYYNKDMFDAAGIDYPKADWTWEDLEQTATDLTNEKKNEVGYAMMGKPDPYDFEMYLWGNGASYTNEKGELAGNLDSKNSIEVFDTFQGMLKNEVAIATEGDGATEMSTGSVGMFVNGSWSMKTLEDAGINYGLVEIPNFTNHKSASIISSSGVSISKYSKHKKEAFEFIKFWTGEEANQERINYELPVLKSVVKENKLESDEIKGVFYRMLERSEEYTPTSFKVENWSDISEKLKLSFEQIFNPSQLTKPKDALKEAVE